MRGWRGVGWFVAVFVAAALVALTAPAGKLPLGTVAAARATSVEPGSPRPAFVLGSKNFAEDEILGNLYEQALKAKGFTVDLTSSIGSTEAAYDALKDGQIQGYPEYDGTLLSTLSGISANPPTAAAAAHEAGAWLAKRGLLFTATTPFTDCSAIAVLKSYAHKHGLRTIADLGKLGKGLVLGANPQFETRNPDGLAGLRKDYGLNLTFHPVATGNLYTLLRDGKLNAAEVYSTDPELQSGEYVILQDPKRFFGFENVGLVLSKRAADEQGPGFLRAVNRVSALLTQKAMIELNWQVELQQKSPVTVAKAFLLAHHLLSARG